MYFIGVTRFSLYNPGSKAWKISSSSEQEYLNSLYSDERLKIRFDIFINKALPIYKIMSDNFFYKHIIQYSSSMPDHWKKRLHKETKDYDFIVLSESNEVIKPLPILDILENEESGTLVYFRVDDDDILSKDYLKNLSKYSSSAFEGMAVSFGMGAIALYHQGKFVDFRQCHRRMLALGMAFIGSYNAKEKSYWLPPLTSHEKVDTQTPIIIDSRENTFIWTQNISQDTKYALNDAEKHIYSLLSEHSPLLEVKLLKNSFPTISTDIDNAYQEMENLVSINNYEIERSGSSFFLKPEKRFLRYLVSYEIQQDFDKNIAENSSRAMTFSFNFEKKPNSVNGLYFSNNPDIGWYTYINIENGFGKRSFIINLDTPNKIESIKIKKYLINSETELKINSLIVTEIGNYFL